MRSITICSGSSVSVIVPFRSIVYPKDKQAFFQGRNFGGRSIREAPHYLTCAQILSGEPIERLAYYHWTLEKLKRFGPAYEEFLFAEDKGCGVSRARRDEFLRMTEPRRHIALARASAESFCSLFHSLNACWDPKLSVRNIVFLRLSRNRFTIAEGRHRVAVLMFLHSSTGIEAFETDRSLVRREHYSTVIRRKLRWFVRRFLARSQLKVRS